MPNYERPAFSPVEKAKPKLLSKQKAKKDEDKAWRKARIAVLERDGHRCRACSSTKGLEVHHVILRSLGGKDEPLNLIALCAACHKAVHGHVLKLRWSNPERPALTLRLEWVK